MADIDPGQVSAVASETLHGVAGLSPAAQVAAVVALAVVALAWIWTRRPQPAAAADGGTLTAVIQALSEQAAATNRVADRVEAVLEQNAALLNQVRGP